MAGSTGRTAACPSSGQGPQWAASEGDPKLLDFNGFGYGQGILKFDAEVSNRAVHLCVAQQELNRTKVARLLLDLGDLGPAH